MPLELIDLDALVAPVARVKLFGAEYDVLPADGRAADLLAQHADRVKHGSGDAGSNAAAGLDVGRLIIADCIPTLPDDQRVRLSPRQITAIVGVASGSINLVKDMIALVEQEREGNGSGPATSTETNRPAKINIPDQSSTSQSAL